MKEDFRAREDALHAVIQTTKWNWLKPTPRIKACRKPCRSPSNRSSPHPQRRIESQSFGCRCSPLLVVQVRGRMPGPKPHWFEVSKKLAGIPLTMPEHAHTQVWAARKFRIDAAAAAEEKPAPPCLPKPHWFVIGLTSRRSLRASHSPCPNMPKPGPPASSCGPGRKRKEASEEEISYLVAPLEGQMGEVSQAFGGAEVMEFRHWPGSSSPPSVKATTSPRARR